MGRPELPLVAKLWKSSYSGDEHCQRPLLQSGMLPVARSESGVLQLPAHDCVLSFVLTVRRICIYQAVKFIILFRSHGGAVHFWLCNFIIISISTERA